MADDKVAMRADDDPMAGAYRSATSANAQARGIASGAAATAQADFDKGQSGVDTVPANDDKKPGPLAPSSSKSPVASVWSSAPETARRVDALNAQSMKLNPPVYKPVPPPVVKNTDPMNVWGSLAMVVAGLGSLKTRQPMNTALNAAAGVIKGFHDGDKEKADAEFKTWQAASDNAIQNARFEMDAYKTAMDGFKHSEDLEFSKEALENRDRTLIMAEMFKDAPMVFALREDPTGKKAAELQKSREDAATKLEQSKIENSANYMVAQATRDLESSPEYQSMTPMERVNAKADIQKQFKQSTGSRYAIPITPEQMPKIVQSLKNYEIDPPNDALMSRNPSWAEALNQAKTEDPSYDPAMAPVIRKARIELATGKGGAVRQSADALTHHLTFLQTLADNLPNTSDMKVVNAAAAAIARQFGYSNVTSYETAVEVVGTEAARMIAGTGANAGALADRLGLKKEFDPGLSKTQIHDNAQTAKILAAGQYSALKHRYDFLPDNVKQTFFKPETDRFYGIDPATGRPQTNLNGPDAGPKPGDKPAASGPMPNAAVPDAAVAHLKSDPTPDMQAKFDEVFGAGAAKRALGGQ